MISRKSLIVYFRSPKALKHIGRIADIKYYTKKRKYAIIYVNEADQDNIVKALKEIKLVRKIEESLVEGEEYQFDFNVQ